MSIDLPTRTTSTSLPMTGAASRALTAELAGLLSPAGGRELPVETASAPEREKRILHLRRVMTMTRVEPNPGSAVIGRRVRVREEDGSEATYTLVIPGDGDPRRGWLAVDAPMGAALIGARRGEAVRVAAPAGDRTLLVLEVM